MFDVAIPRADESEVRRLQTSAAAALGRHRRAPIGDLTEAVRFEHLQTAINEIAFAELNRSRGGNPTAELSDLIVRVVWPFKPGTSPPALAVRKPKPVAHVFRSELEHPTRRTAIDERFKSQLRRAVGEEVAEGQEIVEAINPSDVPNRVLSEALREFFQVRGRGPVDVPVVYRDGSPARPLRLRSVELTETIPDDGRPVLRVTLLSVRHMEMDAEVDGAWLRNREISLPRPTGQTDEIAYQQSRQQFTALTADGPLELHLYQTGLPPANIGFYRALIDHHLQRSGHPVAVVPRYFEGSDGFSDGLPWVVAR